MTQVYLKQVKTVQFEISSNCNAACPGCVRFLPVSLADDNQWLEKNVFLSTEVYSSILRGLFDQGLQRVEFCGTIDDPIMHPDFLDMLEIAASMGLNIKVHTNAGARTPEYFGEMARILQTTRQQCQLQH